jgi:hypothetical protein
MDLAAQFRFWSDQMIGSEALKELQVAFFKGFIDTMKAPPTWLRMVNKRGTFFLPLDPRRPPSSSLPKLLKR